MANIRISQSGVEFLNDVRHYLQHSELADEDPTLMFKAEQQQAVILEILDEAPDEGLDMDYLVALAQNKTAWRIETVKRIISDLYRKGKKIEVYMPDVDYAPSSTERELGSKKIEELRRIHRQDQVLGWDKAHWCEKCQRYHESEHCPICG